MRITADELILYRNFDYPEVFDNITRIIGNCHSTTWDKHALKPLLFKSMAQLADIAEQYGLEGNLWHGYLTFVLAFNENPFSTACEIVGNPGGSISEIAFRDLTLFKELFDFDIALIDTALDLDFSGMFSHYKSAGNKNRALNADLRNKINNLAVNLGSAPDPRSFFNAVTDFYKSCGVGKLGLHKGFRVISSQDEPVLEPIANTDPVRLNDLVGYQRQKKELIKNTEDFIQGRKANNVLLYGDSGTGKSSSVKAILNQYWDQGLRMIEVYKHQFQYLSAIISQIENRNYKFIILMDDLSFEDHETEYKYLKAIIEGGLATRPCNVLLYATSNRRHLIREKWSDKDDRDDDLHTNDTVQEKLSLAARFGLSILYISPDRKEYEHIVKVLAEKYNLHMPEEELFLEANRWEIRHGGLSGRTAQHFITYLAGKK